MQSGMLLGTILLAMGLPCADASQQRSVMMWWDSGCMAKPLKGFPLIPTCPPSQSWIDARIANMSKRRANFTGVIPILHTITAAGTFGKVTTEGPSHAYDLIAPYLPAFKAMKLDIIPIIDLSGGMPGLQRVVSKTAAATFIKAAVATAVEQGYAGYNVDVEARGGASDASWAYLKPYAKPWMELLNAFADAMHAQNKTLSVDISGCCGWMDKEHGSKPAGHCTGAFANYEFVATTCPMYKESRLDTVYGMGTYSDSLVSNFTYGPRFLKEMASAASSAVGASKYGLGIKGGWSSLRELDETAKETILYLRDTLGVSAMSHWVDEPGRYLWNDIQVQAQWDAWGLFLHGDAAGTGKKVYV